MVNPETMTVLPVPTALSVKTPAAVVFSETVSPETTPTMAALLVFNVTALVPSYSLLFAVTPLTVKGLSVIAPVLTLVNVTV